MKDFLCMVKILTYLVAYTHVFELFSIPKSPLFMPTKLPHTKIKKCYLSIYVTLFVILINGGGSLIVNANISIMQLCASCDKITDARPNKKADEASSAFLFSNTNNLLLRQFACRTKHIDNLVLVEFFHVLTSGAKIFTRIELCRFLCKYLTNSCSHCQTAVRVNVDLANS